MKQRYVHHLLCTWNKLAEQNIPYQAAVDVQTDATLQATLRSSAFRDRTIITIAHRINTILDSDRVVVLERGEVAEFDTPSELIRRKGLFYKLVEEAGLVDRINPGPETDRAGVLAAKE